MRSIPLNLVICGIAVHHLETHVAGAMTLEAVDILLRGTAKLGGELDAHDLSEAAGSCGKNQHPPLAGAEVDEDAVPRDP